MFKKFTLLLSLLFCVSCAITNSAVSPISYVESVDDLGRETAVSIAYRSFGMIYGTRTGAGKPSVVGTAFAVSNDLLVTAGHVCVSILQGQILRGFKQNTYLQHLTSYNSSMRTIDGLKIEEIDTKNDLCLLVRKNHGLVPLKMSSGKYIQNRDKVTILGSPAGTFPFETEGRVAYMDAYEALNFFRDKKFKGKILISAPSYGGNSGGPIIDRSGRLIGVLVMGHRGYPQLSIATHVDRVREFLKEYGK